MSLKSLLTPLATAVVTLIASLMAGCNLSGVGREYEYSDPANGTRVTSLRISPYTQLMRIDATPPRLVLFTERETRNEHADIYETVVVLDGGAETIRLPATSRLRDVSAGTSAVTYIESVTVPVPAETLRRMATARAVSVGYNGRGENHPPAPVSSEALSLIRRFVASHAPLQ